MPFTKHCTALNKFHDALSSIPKPSHLQILVRDAIGVITQNCSIFDNCVTLDSPFFSEFFDCMDLQDPKNLDDESCFSIFECLCIFFREKRLRFGYSRLTTQEISLLDYFENSGHWDQSDDTIVGNWYWRTLPEKVINDSLDSKS